MKQNKRWIVILMDYADPHLGNEIISSFETKSDAMDYMFSAYSRELEFVYGPEGVGRIDYDCFSEQIIHLYRVENTEWGQGPSELEKDGRAKPMPQMENIFGHNDGNCEWPHCTCSASQRCETIPEPRWDRN